MNGLLRRPAPWLALGVVLLAGTILVVVGAHRPAARSDTTRTSDLAAEVRRFAAGLHAGDPYRPPEPAQRRRLLSALHALEAGKATHAADGLGFTARTGVDEETGRRFGLLANGPGERAWGWYLVDLSAPVRLVIEVPHPNSDLHTEEIGLALYQAVPGSVLLVAGTHRRAGAGAGDVAHRTDSMFHAVATDLAARGLPQVQLHGFHDDNLPDTDVVVSPGAGDAGAAVRRVADRIDADLRVCRSWRQDCGRLEGTTNVQGRDAARRGTLFLHVEISRAVRDDRVAWSKLVRAIARADLGRG
ncbi:hypothetical protein [Actinophytocola sp.]|uniref:hypothetical protein n=1 Tax=Actinophytocola sp. TaxID=1872138 RepID=UPI00389A5FA5